MQRWTLATPIFLLCSAISFAQIGAALLEAHARPGVKGVPFSADVTIQTKHVLEDGNQINSDVSGKIFRDSEGRVRDESTRMLPGSVHPFHGVNIIDPVQRVSVFLDVEHKIARVHHMRVPVPMPARSANPNRPVEATENSTTTELQARSSAVKRENLGTQEIEGFLATGTRRTRTIAAGTMGNEKPIVNVSEIWYSEELRQILLEEVDDPQIGHRLMKVTNIQRGDPDPALFQIPPDYTVKDVPGPQAPTTDNPAQP